MRGTTSRQIAMLGVIDPEQLIPADHLIRRVRPLVAAALAELEPTFEHMYAEIGRPSIPPEHLLKSCQLMAFYSIRSKRQFCERLGYYLFFEWFLDLNVEDEPSDHSSFAKSRQRLLDHRVSAVLRGGAGPSAAAPPALLAAFHRGRHRARVLSLNEEAAPAPGRWAGDARGWGRAERRRGPPRPTERQ